MNLISVGIDEDIFNYVSAVVADEALRVENAEGVFINLLLRKALGVDTDLGLDPLIDDVIETMDGIANR